MNYTNEFANASSIGSDRLRKAIERNRLKQFKRDSRSKGSEETSTSAFSSRRTGVATKPEDVEIIERPARKKSRLLESTDDYIPTSARKITTSKFKKWLNLETLGYLFIAFISFRLLFADRGVLDYWRRHTTLSERMQYHQSILKENKQLQTEISRIEKDESYQKQLVRDLLGFIGNGETLIVFAGE